MSEIISLDSRRHPEKPEGSSFLSPREKVHLIHEQAGFYPQTNQEASLALNLIGREEAVNPVLAHLNEVYLHQRRYQVDEPQAALRSIVNSIDGYAGGALNEISHMDTFAAIVEENQAHPLASFANTFPIETWRDAPILRAVFTSLTRHNEISEFVQGTGKNTLGQRALIDNTLKDERVARIVESLGTKRLSGLTGTANAVKKNQENRFDFWAETLVDARRHLFVRDIATQALQNYGPGYKK